MKKISFIVISILIFSNIFAQQSTTGKYRPINVNKGIVSKSTTNQTVINNVPSYLWQHGCGPTSLGMLIGYYDGIGLSDLIYGNASTQNSYVNDAIANSDHYDDYSIPIDNYPDLFLDKSDLGGAHTSNCIADFMKTSWSYDSNRYGWSWSDMIDVAFVDYVHQQNSNYNLFTSYEWFSNSSWNIYINEINNDRPVILLVDSDGDGDTDHFVIGIGYDNTDSTYAIYDTWDNNIHWYQWREMSTNYSWGIFGFNILKFYFNISASVTPTNGGTINGIGYFDYGQTANLTATAQTGYDFVNWTENGIQVSTDTNYSFTVTANRTLMANFQIATSDINKIVDDLFLNIYPNPTNNYLQVESKEFKVESYTIYDIYGRNIKQLKIYNSKIIIKVEGLPKGIYFIKLQTKKGIIIKRFIKK